MKPKREEPAAGGTPDRPSPPALNLGDPFRDGPAAGTGLPVAVALRWQELVDRLARTLPADLVRETAGEGFAVRIASASTDPPYRIGEVAPSGASAPRGSGPAVTPQAEAASPSARVTCEMNAVVLTGADADRGFVAARGLPLVRPDGSVYGALVALERDTRAIHPDGPALLQRAREILEADLALLHAMSGGTSARTYHETLVETAGDAIFVMDRTRFIDCNRRTEEMFGAPREEFLGRPPWRFSPEEQPNGRPSLEMAEEFIAAALAGTPQRFAWRHLRADGNPFEAEVSLSALEMTTGTFLLAIVRDESVRMHALEALRTSEEKFSKAFHATPDSITLTSARDGRFLEVNEGFERLFGWQREEALGRSSLDLGIWVRPEDRDRAVAALRAGQTVRDWEIPYRRKNGTVRSGEMSMERLDVRGEPHLIVIARDISHRKEAEAERERAYAEVGRLKEELERERDYLREEVAVSHNHGEIIGESPVLQRVLARIEAVAATRATVLILGESGVGKELLARAIHAQSPRRDRALVKVNCPSIPQELFESEFFGHVRGAFTGAHRDRIGRFQLAHEGTLFLDEIAEIPLTLQSKLLRVLQEGEFERIGEDETRRVDVRIIAATNRDLRTEVAAGRFREDLYYRLSVFPLEVPPLRQRREDVVPLALHFLRSACRDFSRPDLALSRSQAEALEEYDWPGNIRELRHVIEEAVILSRGDRLRLELALPTRDGEDVRARTGAPVAERAAESSATGAASAAAGSSAGPAAGFGAGSAAATTSERAFLTAAELEDAERRNLVAALEQAGWRVSGAGGAAELLGIPPSTFSYRMRALGVERKKRAR